MKKYALFAVVAAVAVLAIFKLAEPSATAQDAKKFSVLIVDGQNNHNWKATTPVLVDALTSSGRYDVEVATSPPKNAPQEEWKDWNPDFSKYDAILSNYNGQMWPDAVGGAFVKYVNDGGAVVIVHAANNSFGMWPEYNEIIGLGGWGGRNEKHGPYVFVKDGEVVRDESPGRGGSHGPQLEFVVEVFDKEHPITKGMPLKWKHAKDELYDSLRGPAKNMTVLATAYAEKSKKNEPIIFTVDYGKGRVFHTPMGHADYSMKCVGFYNTLQRGTEWAITGEVTIPISDNFPTEEAISPVE
ncbi:MAG: ThuA domain-containing protein [Verrucomicrobiota bacterium]